MLYLKSTTNTDMPADSSTPKKRSQKYFLVFPKLTSELNQHRTPVEKEEPSAYSDNEYSNHDSHDNVKDTQTPQKAAASNRRRNYQMTEEDEAEIAKIDAVLAAVTPPRSKTKPKLVARSINLTPSTDYRNLKESTVEKNIEEVYAAIASSKLNSPSINKSNNFVSPSTQSLFSDSPLNESTSSSLSTPMLSNKAAVATPETNDLTMTPNTIFKTSLKRDRLMRNFKEALELNMKAKKKFCKSEKEYYQQIGESKKAARMSQEIEKLPSVFDIAMEYVKTTTENYTEESVRAVLLRMQELQSAAKKYIDERKERRRRRSQTYEAVSSTVEVKTNKEPRSVAVSDTSFQSSCNETTHSSNRKKSWDTVETGIFKKQYQSKQDTIQADIEQIFSSELPKFECAPPAMGPYTTVLPKDERRNSFGHPKSTTCVNEDTTSNVSDSLHDVSLSKSNAPILDISGESDLGSLSPKDGKNVSEWSPELLTKEPQRLEDTKADGIAPVSKATVIKTPILEKSVKEVSEEVQRICTKIWPQLDEGDFIVLDYADFDETSRCHDAFRRLLAEIIISEVKNLQIQNISFEKFLKWMTEMVLTKLSIERKNDLLDRRHVWVRKNSCFAKIVGPKEIKEQDDKLEMVNDYKRVIVTKAIAYEEIIDYLKNSSHQKADIAYQECIKFMEKHEPEKLEALLSQY